MIKTIFLALGIMILFFISLSLRNIIKKDRTPQAGCKGHKKTCHVCDKKEK